MEHRTMVALRTQATIALLAFGQLRRSCPTDPDVARLARFASEALAGIRKDVARIDALIATLEDREAMAADPVRLRHRRPDTR